jgi:hypothetical protein
MDLRRWRDAASAADYYERRMVRLLALWPSLPASRRVAVTHDQLTGEAEILLPRLGAWLGLRAPLRNSYSAIAPGHARGGGDPLMAARRSSIVRSEEASSLPADVAIDLPAARLDALEALFDEFRSLCLPSWCGDEASAPAAPGATGAHHPT